MYVYISLFLNCFSLVYIYNTYISVPKAAKRLTHSKKIKEELKEYTVIMLAGPIYNEWIQMLGRGA